MAATSSKMGLALGAPYTEVIGVWDTMWLNCGPLDKALGKTRVEEADFLLLQWFLQPLSYELRITFSVLCVILYAVCLLKPWDTCFEDLWPLLAGIWMNYLEVFFSLLRGFIIYILEAFNQSYTFDIGFNHVEGVGLPCFWILPYQSSFFNICII